MRTAKAKAKRARKNASARPKTAPSPAPEPAPAITPEPASPRESAPPRESASRLKWGGFEWLMLALIALGVGCRFYGLGWGDGAMLHPDERFVIDVMFKIGWPSSVLGWLDAATSPFNPANSPDVHYVYGQFPLLLGKLAAQLLGRADMVSFVAVGRALSALFDSFTVGLTYLVARRIFETKWALFAAALVAVAALHVQQSHYFTVDNFAACWMLASFWGAARWLESGRARDAMGAGACLGLALSCKISAIFIALPLLAILLFGVRKYRPRAVTWSALGCLVAAAVCFRVFNPMAFRGLLDWGLEPRFGSELAAQAAITRGEVDVPFDVQWIGRAPWVFSLFNLSVWGYGWGLLVSGALGIGLVAFNWAKSGWKTAPNNRLILLLSSTLFCLALLGIQGAAFSKFTRYFLPMTPFVAFLAAYLWREASARWRVLQWGAPLIAVFSALWCVAVTEIYGRPHSRLAASNWIARNIPNGTPIANETAWDEELPLGPLPPGTGDFKRLTLNSYDNDTPEKRAKLLETLDKTQWIFLSSGRSWQNIPRWPAKWPMTSRFYYALWSGELGFTLEEEFTSYPRLGPLQFPDDDAEEALSVYDHPRVLLWKKNSNYSPQKAEQILSAVALPDQQNWQPRNARF